MPQVSKHIPQPHPSQWNLSSSSGLRAAIASITSVANLQTFRDRPARHAERWARVKARLLHPDGSFNYDGVESLAGLHFQHVALTALAQEMLDRVVNDELATEWARARLRSCSQFGSGD